MQHLPDGSVTVESILVQAAAHSEDPGTKVLLVSWTYQVRAGLVGSPYHPGQAGQGDRPTAVLACGCRMRSWEATLHLCSRRACPRPAEAPWTVEGPGFRSRTVYAPVFPVSLGVDLTVHLCREHRAMYLLELLLAKETDLGGFSSFISTPGLPGDGWGLLGC